MKSETLQQIAKIVARKIHSDQSTSIDVFLDNGDFYQVDLYDYKIPYDAETQRITWDDNGEEANADIIDLAEFDEYMTEYIYNLS